MAKQSASTHLKTTNYLITLRKITQSLALIVFLALMIETAIDRAPHDLTNIPIRLSPLAMLASLISSRTFLSGMTISLILLLSSLLVGRAWCGWICPMGTVLDIFRFQKSKSGRKLPENFRAIKYGLLIVLLFSAIFSNLTLLVFDPLTILTRTMTLSILPVIDQVITAIEKTLINVPFLTGAIYQFDLWIRPAILPIEPAVFQYTILNGFFFIGIILLNLLAERFWCRYLCPLGALLGLVSRLSLVKRNVKDTCIQCHLCELHCPTGTINPQKKFTSDPAECTLCLNCLKDCQKNSLSFSPSLSLAPRSDYDPGRRTVLNAFLVSLSLTALLSIEWIKRYPRRHALRPPGADGEKLTSTCTRCGLCMKVCPTGALQVNLVESRIEAAGTPVFVPRLGFCQYSCNACGQICPVGAIPALELKEKQTKIIGKAYIDHDRCIAWSDHQTCIVCEEMCPLPNKAISLESGEFSSPTGDTMTISLPVVNREVCIGCGICENKCPVAGEAAIRVYTF